MANMDVTRVLIVGLFNENADVRLPDDIRPPALILIVLLSIKPTGAAKSLHQSTYPHHG